MLLLLRIAAWLLVLAIAFVTLSPIGLRPVTGEPPSLERMAAFALMGGLFAMAYPRHRIAVLLFVVIVAGALEAAQHLVPGRHGRMADFAVKAAAGVLAAALIMIGRWIAARAAPRQTVPQEPG